MQFDRPTLYYDPTPWCTMKRSMTFPAFRARVLGGITLQTTEEERLVRRAYDNVPLTSDADFDQAATTAIRDIQSRRAYARELSRRRETRTHATHTMVLERRMGAEDDESESRLD